MKVNIWIDGYHKEIDLDSDDLAPLIADYYGIDEEKASLLISDFDLHDMIYDKWYDEVQEIAYEKWKCNY